MRHGQLFLTAIVVSFYLVSCGAKKSEPAVDQIHTEDLSEKYQLPDNTHKSSLPDEKKKLTFEEIQAEILAKTTLTCATNHNCPKSMASLTIVDPNDKEEADHFSSCTGFLVNSSLLATNVHCIAHIKDLDCSKTVVADFIDGSKRHCKAIYFDKNTADLGSAEDFSFSPDLALIELDIPVSQDLLDRKISHAGFKDAEKVKVTKIDRSIVDPSIARAYVVECEVLEDTLYNSQYSADFILYPSLYNCSKIIKSGNSGSMIVNANGEIGGIVFASSKNRQELEGRLDNSFLGDFYRSESEKRALQVLKSMPNFAIGVNFACMTLDESIPSITWSDKPECERDASIASEKNLEKTKAQFFENVGDIFATALADFGEKEKIEQSFAHMEVTLDNDQMIELSPTCFQYKIYKEWYAPNANKQPKLPHYIYGFRIHKNVALDKNYRMKPAPVVEVSVAYYFRIESKKLSLNYKPDLARFLDDVQSDKSILKTGKIQSITLEDCDQSIIDLEDQFLKELE